MGSDLSSCGFQADEENWTSAERRGTAPRQMQQAQKTFLMPEENLEREGDPTYPQMEIFIQKAQILQLMILQEYDSFPVEVHMDIV